MDVLLPLLAVSFVDRIVCSSDEPMVKFLTTPDDSRLCPPNQYYACRHRTCPFSCEQFFKNGISWLCDAPNGFCSSQCWCYPGSFFLDSVGQCVSIEQCSMGCQDPNALLVKCPNPCPATCDNIFQKDVPCNKTCEATGCECRVGYVLHKGSCIPASMCPNLSCPPGRTLDKCFKLCERPQTCYELFNVIDCIGDLTLCFPQCLCPKGLYDNGTACVTDEECCGDNNKRAVSCWDDCDMTCYGEREISCLGACVNLRCGCKDGYVRDNDNNCIPPEECKNRIACPGKNEEFDLCVDPCRATCKSLTTGEVPPGCNQVSTLISFTTQSFKNDCRGGCDCKPGFYRTPDGKQCVPFEQCPLLPCQDINAVRKPCGDPCPLTCDNFENPPSVCRDICLVNGCVCKEDFVLNNNGTCVDRIKCPCKGNNEERTPCGDYCPITCDNKDVNPRICNKNCFPGGCTCKQGYVRNDKGECILPEKCPLPPCEDQNAVRKPCGDTCPVTCENMHDPPKICPKICTISECVCKEGFVKSKNGTCVQAIECPCEGENEVRAACGDPCPISCDNKDDKSPRICPAICLINNCACKPGYVRDKNNKCIKPDKCPIKCKEPNTVWDPCGSACPPTCSKKINSCNKKCVPGCFCKKGFILNDNKKCIPIKKCNNYYG